MRLSRVGWEPESAVTDCSGWAVEVLMERESMRYTGGKSQEWKSDEVEAGEITAADNIMKKLEQGGRPLKPKARAWVARKWP